MILHLVRHPRSKPESDTVDDAQRQVTKKGAKKFRAVLKQYAAANEMSPDVIFCGPETRNMQSAAIAQDYFQIDPDRLVQTTGLSPAGDPKQAWSDITQWLKDNGDDSTEVLAIGSNPALKLLFQMVHGLGTKAGQSGNVKLKKGSVAKLKVYNPLDPKKASSELRSYLPPGLAAGRK